MPLLAPVRAAPQMQATSCLGTTITQWTFTGDVTTPSTGSGTFSAGSGLSGPTFSTGASGGTDRAVSFSSWTTVTPLDPTDYIDLIVPTIGRNSIGINFDYRSSANGPRSLELHYSTDGINFVLFGAPTTIANDATFHPLSFDLSAITALDDNPNAVFRLYGYFALGAGGTLRLDNVIITGNCLFPAPTSTYTATDTPTSTSTPTATATATFTPTNTATPTVTPTRTNTATPVGFMSVIINEVAWAGTASALTNDEWIELYNPGSNPVDMTGWTLKAADGAPSIALVGSVPAGGYFLLERTDDATVLDVAADQIYTGALGNNFETLQLFDSANRLVDTAKSKNDGNWPAGSSITFASMERRGVVIDSATAWFTFAGTPYAHDRNNNLIKGTPKQANWALTVTATPSATPTRTRTPLPPPTQTRVPTLAPVPRVAINEFVPRPGHDWNNNGVVNVEDEYIEIINHGTIDVNLNGYSLDDEVNIGSNPFPLPGVTIKPGERIVFYGSKTGLLLSDGGDGVRLLRPNGQLADAYNYTVVRFPDQSFCRLPDDGGADDWSRNCYPTPGLKNALSGSFVNPPPSVEEEMLCPIADTLPIDFILAECPPFGNNIWRPAYWDNPGWYGENYLPESPGKWPVFVD